jgi:hypothetical protein
MMINQKRQCYVEITYIKYFVIINKIVILHMDIMKFIAITTRKVIVKTGTIVIDCISGLEHNKFISKYFKN